MIDLLHLIIELDHAPFGNKRIIRSESGKAPKTKRFTKKVKLYADGASIDVTSMNGGTRIAIRCCPLKPLQGHNIFGSNQVIGLGYKIIRYILSEIGITAPAAKWKAWKKGKFALVELHITNRFAVDSHKFVDRVLRHLLRNVNRRWLAAPLEAGSGLRMRNPTTGAKWLLYNKLREFDDKRTKEGKHLTALIGANGHAVIELLRDAATANIRTELKLDKKYLTKSSLATGSAWSKSLVKSVFLGELALLRLGSVPSLDYGNVLLDRLEDRKLRATFLAWMQDEDLSTFHERQTLNSRREAILKEVGIDIALDRMPIKNSPVSLARIFTSLNMLPDFPDWEDSHPAVVFRGKLHRPKS